MATKVKKAHEKKPDGWFSRRHETAEAHLAAKEARSRRAEQRPKQVWNEETNEWEKRWE